MKKFNKSNTQFILNEAKASSRLRKNFNLHQEDADTLQRLFNAMEPGTYIRPHKHSSPPKREVFMVFRGKIAILEFDDEGNITDQIILGPDTGNYLAEIAPDTWHSLICLERSSLSFEVKDGPYDPTEDKIFADWSPEEGSSESDAFIRKIIEDSGITF